MSKIICAWFYFFLLLFLFQFLFEGRLLLISIHIDYLKKKKNRTDKTITLIIISKNYTWSQLYINSNQILSLQNNSECGRYGHLSGSLPMCQSSSKMAASIIADYGPPQNWRVWRHERTDRDRIWNIITYRYWGIIVKKLSSVNDSK